MDNSNIEVKMILGDHQPLYDALDAFFKKHSSTVKEKFDSEVYKKLYKQFLEENPHIDWNSWKFIPDEVQRRHEALPEFDEKRKDVLSRLAVIRLNGGLGTTMGCEGPKSFIKVKEDLSFLDIAIKQHEAFNTTHNCEVPLYLMNSFYTDELTKPALKPWIRTFNQARCPRIYSDSKLPVEETGADEEWYPPGHGNIFQSLQFSGVMDQLLDEGRDIIFVSNIDNTGAALDPKIAQFFVDQEADYLMECTEKTQSDIKGGTLISINNHLMHLEMPQVPPDHLDEFCSTRVFKIFNTNNIWVSLRAAKERMETRKSEIIVNKKKLNGREVIQLETSIGGCIRNFPKAYCVHVGRERFLPVKRTDDLLAISSSLYSLTPQYTLALSGPSPAPVVNLGKFFEKVADFHERIPVYPEMRGLRKLTVEGDVVFGENLTLAGEISIINQSGRQVRLENKTIDEDVVF